jgi:ACS family glucarate transporter-like MFS transporter
VPVSVSSLLTEKDVSDLHGFAKVLTESATSPAARLAAVIRPMLSAEKLPHANAQPATYLIEGLNQLIRRRDLYDSVDLNEFALPDEAYRLAAVPTHELTEAEVERRNRLLLEAAFPDYIRKIHGQGWRPTLLVYGVAGLIVAGLFWLVVRDRPANHPHCNAAEVTLIEAGRLAADPHGKVGAIPWEHMVRSWNLWLSSISQFGTNFGWVFLITWLPRYLAEVHHVPVIERGWLAGVPMLIGMFGMVGGGWLTDRLTLALGLRWGRRIPMAMTRFLAMAAYIACVFVDSPLAATVAFCVVAIATDLGTAAVWAFNQDIAGKHVGSVLGWGNMWGSVGAACSAIVLNSLIENSGWPAAFVACALAFLLSGVTALGVDATVPIIVADNCETKG